MDEPAAPKPPSGPPTILPSDPPSNIPTSLNDTPDPYQEKNYNLNRSQFGVATVTVIVLFIYTVIAGYQAWKMRTATIAATESADTARDALIRSQRPWLVNDGEAMFTVDGSGEDSASLTFTFKVKNFGPAPALDVGYGIHPFVRNLADKPNLFEDARKQACELADSAVSVRGDSIFPQQAITYTSKGGFIVPGFSKVTMVLFYGCIAYRDQFDTQHTTHHTTFCQFGPIRKPNSLSFCGVHEIAD